MIPATFSIALRTLSDSSVIAPMTASVMTASTTPYSAIVWPSSRRRRASSVEAAYACVKAKSFSNEFTSLRVVGEVSEDGFSWAVRGSTPGLLRFVLQRGRTALSGACVIGGGRPCAVSLAGAIRYRKGFGLGVAAKQQHRREREDEGAVRGEQQAAPQRRQRRRVVRQREELPPCLARQVLADGVVPARRQDVHQRRDHEEDPGEGGDPARRVADDRAEAEREDPDEHDVEGAAEDRACDAWVRQG